MHTVIFVGFAKMFILELDINHFERELSVLDLDSVESIDVVEGVLVHLNHILHLIPFDGLIFGIEKKLKKKKKNITH